MLPSCRRLIGIFVVGLAFVTGQVAVAHAQGSSETLRRIGEARLDQGDFAGALSAYGEAVALAERFAKASPDDDLRKEQLADAYRDLAAVFSAQGDLPQMLQCLYDDLVIRKQLAAGHSEEPLKLFMLARSYEDIGKVLLQQGQWDRSLDFFNDNLVVMQRTVELQPGNDLWDAKMGHAYGLVGVALAKLGRRPEARENLLKGRAVVERIRESRERLSDVLAWYDRELVALD